MMIAPTKLTNIFMQGWTIPDYFAGFNGYTPSEVGHATKGLFGLTSSNTGVIRVNATTGEYTVLANSVLPVTVSATTRTTCGSVVPLTTTMYGNLLPEPVDVDVGSATGAPLAAPMTSFQVRLATDGAAVLDVLVHLTYPAGTINVTACAVHTGFSMVDCTFDNPGFILITGFVTRPGIANPTTIVLATITVLPVPTTGGTAPVDIVATIVTLTTATKVCNQNARCVVTAAARTPVVARISSNRRLLEATVQPLRASRISSNRRLLEATVQPLRASRRLLQTGFVHGDTDGDGSFTINDIRYAIDYYMDRKNVTTNQARALLPVNDTFLNDWHRDVFFLFMVQIGKSRFVQDITVVSTLNRVELSVAVFTANNTAETDEMHVKPVFFIDTTQSSMVFNCPTDYDGVAQKLAVYPKHTANGVYSAIADGSTTPSWDSQQGVSVALGMQLLNNARQATSDRRMSFFSISSQGFASIQPFRGFKTVNLVSSGIPVKTTTNAAQVAATTTVSAVVSTTPTPVAVTTTPKLMTTTAAPTIVSTTSTSMPTTPTPSIQTTVSSVPTTPTPSLVTTTSNIVTTTANTITTTPPPSVVPVYNQTVQSNYYNLSLPLTVKLTTGNDTLASIFIAANTFSATVVGQTVRVTVVGSNTLAASVVPLKDVLASLVTTISIMSSAAVRLNKNVVVTLNTFVASVPTRGLLSLNPVNRRLLQVQTAAIPVGMWLNTSSGQWQTVQDQLYVPGL